MGSLVARYSTLGEAGAARSALDAAGIDCWLADEWFIGVDWLTANAVGWVKLVVFDEAMGEDAAEVLSSTAIADESAEPAAAVVEDVDGAPGCPACQSPDVQRIPRFLIFCGLCVVAIGVGVAAEQPGLILVLVAVLGLLAAVAPSHRCRNCGERWTADEPERPLYAPPPAASDAADMLCRRCGSPELHRVHYRRLAVIPMFFTLAIFIVVFLWLLLPRWRCDNCGRRFWFR